MRRIPFTGRHACHQLARRASPLSAGQPQPGPPQRHEPHPASRPGRDDVAGRFVRQLPAGATAATSQNRPALATTNPQRRARTTPRLLPRTIQLCIHCRANPAGFWVSRSNDQTVRRPWCLSCCQDLDPGCHHVKPFDSQNNREQA